MASLYELIKPGERVVLQGALGFSRLKNPEDSMSQFTEGKVYSIQLIDPKLAETGDKWGLKSNGADTELGKHILDEGISHGAFRFKKQPNAGKLGWSFEVPAADDTHPNRRPISIMDLKHPGDLQPAPDFLDNELASGQTVLVGVSSYTYNHAGRTGVSMGVDFVGLPDASHPKYFTGGGASAFASMFDTPSDGANTSASAPKATAPKAETSSNDGNDGNEVTDSDIDNLFS